ncbi:hypothetical protein NUM3379_37750 [Kineococcus sp. NUM-3379]
MSTPDATTPDATTPDATTPAAAAALRALGAERFVSLTTFRRDGTPVPTAVWVAPDGDGLVVTTPAGSGKVKRLRNDGRVELRPCDRTGRVADGAAVVAARARVLGPESAERRRADLIRAKYGAEYRVVVVVERLVGLVRRVRRGASPQRRDRLILRLAAA